MIKLCGIIAVLSLLFVSKSFAIETESLTALENIPFELLNDDEVNQKDVLSNSPPANVITLNHLKVIGRGIQNRRTHEAIFLSCIGPNLPGTESPSCNRLRHVRVNENTKEVSYIGGEFGILDSWETEKIKSSPEPTTEELKVYVKKINRAFKRYKKRVHSETRTRIFGKILLYGATSLELATVIGTWGMASIPGALIILPTAGGAVLIVGVYKLFSTPIRPTSGVISEMMANQDGWSWSVSPKKVSPRSYHWFERYLNHN